MHSIKESKYSSTFGSLRSQIEALFGDLGNMFERHSNRAPVIIDKKNTYNLHADEAGVVAFKYQEDGRSVRISTELTHTSWMRDDFDYPREDQNVEQTTDYFSMNELLEDGDTMARMQEGIWLWPLVMKILQ